MSRKLLLAVVVGVASVSTLAVAQNQPDGGGNNGGGNNGGGGGGGGRQGGGGGRGNFDPAAFRQQMLDQMKTELKAPDDEWAVIQPKLEAVTKAQNDARVGGRGGRGGPGGGGGGGGPGGGGGGQPQSDLAKASQELRTALDAENATPETIAAKLKAVRDARTKAEEALKTSREELKGVLSERQEAVLVSRGILE